MPASPRMINVCGMRVSQASVKVRQSMSRSECRPVRGTVLSAKSPRPWRTARGPDTSVACVHACGGKRRATEGSACSAVGTNMVGASSKSNPPRTDSCTDVSLKSSGSSRLNNASSASAAEAGLLTKSFSVSSLTQALSPIGTSNSGSSSGTGSERCMRASL